MTQFQIKITSERIKLESRDTTFQKALEKAFLTVINFFNSLFFKTTQSAKQNYLLFMEQHCI